MTNEPSSKATDAQPSKTWAAIGKLAVVISLFIGLFTLYGHIFPVRPYLHAHCQGIDLQQRPEMGATPTVTANLLRTSKYVHCDIRNDGEQEAKDSELAIPNPPDYAMVRSTVLSEKDVKEQALNLGTIRPKGTVEVALWYGIQDVYAFDGEHYSLSFSGGVGDVSFPVQSYGWVGSVSGFLNELRENPWLLVFGLGTLVLLVLGPIVEHKKMQAAAPKGENSLTVPTNEQK
jgi:hypothetical protein